MPALASGALTSLALGVAMTSTTGVAQAAIVTALTGVLGLTAVIALRGASHPETAATDDAHAASMLSDGDPTGAEATGRGEGEASLPHAPMPGAVDADGPGAGWTASADGLRLSNEVARAHLLTEAPRAGADTTDTALADTSPAGTALANAPLADAVLAGTNPSNEPLPDTMLADAAPAGTSPADAAPSLPDTPAGRARPVHPVSGPDPAQLAPIPATSPAGGPTLASAPTPAVPETEQENPSFSFEALAQRIIASSDPLDELRLFVREVRRRRRRRTPDFPTPYERFVARMLTEAGIFAEDVELPHVSVVRPPASGMLYLRIADPQLPYLAKARVLGIEAALNAARFSDTYFDDPNARTLIEHYQLLQRLTRSVCAQSPNLSEHVPVIEDDDPDTEWAVRLGISTAIESLQLPHRLEASFRTNVADGNVALRIELPPAEAFPGSTYVGGLGLVPSTRDLRRRASSDYALRLALLVAACAFRCSTKVLHVWVAATQETATRHSCYLSVDFDRWRFERLDLADLGDLGEVYHRFAATVRLEGAILRPVQETFALEEPRFCPPRRFTAVSLSPRRLGPEHAEALGTNHVSGLAIDESTKRELVAQQIMQKAGTTTEESVRAILEIAGDDPDPSVRSAAERCVSKLIEGTVDGDPFSICAEFVGGDDLTQGVREAQDALQHRDVPGARRRLEAVLGPLERRGLYADSPTIEYRYFGSYVDRALYNRFFALPGHTALLVPESYFQAHLLLSVACLMMGDGEEALHHARRLVEMAPIDAKARLQLVRCLETQGLRKEATDALSELLLIAHDPEGLGIGYYRMAFFQWQAGNLLTAQACYLRAMRFLPAAIPVVAMELAAMALQNPGTLRDELSDEEADELLQDHGVPVAPTNRVTETFAECARASLDAEVFPVARNFAQLLAAFTHDDIMNGLVRSIEDAPDA